MTKNILFPGLSWLGTMHAVGRGTTDYDIAEKGSS